MASFVLLYTFKVLGRYKLIETEMDETIFGGGYGISDFVLSDAYKCSSGSENCNTLSS
jgi:hypothetical protein